MLLDNSDSDDEEGKDKEFSADANTGMLVPSRRTMQPPNKRPTAVTAGTSSEDDAGYRSPSANRAYLTEGAHPLYQTNEVRARAHGFFKTAEHARAWSLASGLAVPPLEPVAAEAMPPPAPSPKKKPRVLAVGPLASGHAVAFQAPLHPGIVSGTAKPLHGAMARQSSQLPSPTQTQGSLSGGERGGAKGLAPGAKSGVFQLTGEGSTATNACGRRVSLLVVEVGCRKKVCAQKWARPLPLNLSRSR